jgi:hypothetical protein
MDYYQSDRPPVDDSGLSGGVTFQLGGAIASSFTAGSTSGFNPDASPQATGGGSNGGSPQTYTIKICVDGVPKSLDVYVVSQTY